MFTTRQVSYVVERMFCDSEATAKERSNLLVVTQQYTKKLQGLQRYLIDTVFKPSDGANEECKNLLRETTKLSHALKTQVNR